MPGRLPPRAWDALALIALLALFAGLHVLLSDPFGVDLWPTPDAMEYVGAAESLLRHGVPGLELSDGAIYPSRYSPGYPAALAVWRWVTRGGQTSALSLNLIVSYLVVALTYLVGRHLAGRGAAFAAAVLCVFSPKMADLAEIAISEPLATLLVMIVTALVIARARRARRVSALLIGFLAGYLCAVRVMNVLFLVYLIPLALLMCRRDRVRDLLWGFVGFWPWVVGLAVLQAWLNGHPLRQGYDLWAPYATEIGVGWSWQYFFIHDPELLNRGRIAPHWLMYPPMLLGVHPHKVATIMFYPWPIVVGVVWFLFREHRRLRRGWAWAVLAGVAANLLVWSMYYFWAPRFFMPLMPLVILIGCAGLMPQRRRGLSVGNVLRVGLLTLTFIHQIWASLWYVDAQGVVRPWSRSERLSLERLDEQIAADAVVIFDTGYVLAQDVLLGEDSERRLINWAIDGEDLLLEESRQYIVPPVREGDGRAPALFQRLWIRSDARAEIEQALADGREVWVLLARPQPWRLERLAAAMPGTVTPSSLDGVRAFSVQRWTP